MFKYLSCVAALCLTGACIAVEVEVPATNPNPSREGYTVRDGKVVMIKGATISDLRGEVTLPTGSRVLPEGIIVFPDGRRERLTENRWVGFDGAYVAADPAPATFEGYYFDNARMYVMRAGVPTVVTEEVVLDNGIHILPTGEYITREGERHRFASDVRIDMNGNFGHRTPTDVSARGVTGRVQTDSGYTTPPAVRPAPTYPVDTSRPASTGKVTVLPGQQSPNPVGNPVELPPAVSSPENGNSTSAPPPNK